MAAVYKLLIYSILYRYFIFCVLASEGESACKYSLIFGGRTENSDVKIIKY